MGFSLIPSYHTAFKKIIFPPSKLAIRWWNTKHTQKEFTGLYLFTAALSQRTK